MASIVRYSTGQPTPILGIEAASQSFKEGDLIHLDSDGKVEIATAGNIDGIARKDASGTTNAEIPYELIELDTVYSCAYKAAATERTDLGLKADFVFTVGAHTLDESGASTDALLVGLDGRDAVGATGGRYLFRFLPTLIA